MGELIGYAQCSTVLQDLTAQHEILTGLGVPGDRIYLDKGLTGTRRARPGVDQALAAVRAGDTLVVPKLDRLAPSHAPGTASRQSALDRTTVVLISRIAGVQGWWRLETGSWRCNELQQ